MNRAILVAAILLASSGAASAKGFLGLGIGPSPAVGDNQFDFDGDGRVGRVLGGFRFARLAVEGSYTAGDAVTSGGNLFDARQASVSGKYSLPLGSGFEAFGRVGLQRTWLSFDGSGSGAYDVSGSGYLVGGGFEYRLNLVATEASIFIDYTYNQADVANDRYSYEYSTRQWILGFTIGI